MSAMPPDQDRALFAGLLSKSRDGDVEAVWCSEVERLRTLLDKAGHVTEFESAAPPGSVPLKLVSETIASEEVGENRRTPRIRRLDES